ncbi:hypothetical protein DID97_09550 [Burkholderia sp. Bp8977]|nr:hypothetical protein DIE10_07925 [Burkholderia sp. Bp9011]RQR96170.1 hypothetical protein DIE09_08105 [Burkholderia sp. Bp9010]RQS78935.1 hypothetical protein DID97_09550 [Burkholderia sp. Bp8977]
MQVIQQTRTIEILRDSSDAMRFETSIRMRRETRPDGWTGLRVELPVNRRVDCKGTRGASRRSTTQAEHDEHASRRAHVPRRASVGDP